MKQENFESKIRRIAQEFDRRPPQQSWEHIQEQLTASPGRKAFRLHLSWGVPLALGAFILLIGILFRPNQHAQNPWLDNYWDGRALAERENKPLLLLFTRNCPACDSLDQILAQSEFVQLTDQYISVRLMVDDPAPLDSASAWQLFPDEPKTITIDPDNRSGAIQLQDGFEVFQTRGQVWKHLQGQPTYYLQQHQPLLTIFDPSGELVSSLDIRLLQQDTNLTIDEAVKEWLNIHVGIFEQGYLPIAKVFTNLCAACHNQNMKDHLTGPALGGVRARWDDYPKEDLYRFIRSSYEMIASGHPKAVTVWKEWQPNLMTNFPSLTDQELEQLLDYIEWRYAYL